MNKNYFLFVIMMLFLSCRAKTEYEKIEQFCVSRGLSKELNNYDFVVVINDQGTCLNCNIMFSQKISNRIDDNKVLFIVSERGVNIDISAYVDTHRDNVIMDEINEFKKLNLVNSCAIFKLKNNKIEEKIPINAYNVKKY